MKFQKDFFPSLCSHEIRISSKRASIKWHYSYCCNNSKRKYCSNLKSSTFVRIESYTWCTSVSFNSYKLENKTIQNMPFSNPGWPWNRGPNQKSTKVSPNKSQCWKPRFCSSLPSSFASMIQPSMAFEATYSCLPAPIDADISCNHWVEWKVLCSFHPSYISLEIVGDNQ